MIVVEGAEQPLDTDKETMLRAKDSMRIATELKNIRMMKTRVKGFQVARAGWQKYPAARLV